MSDPHEIKREFEVVIPDDATDDQAEALILKREDEEIDDILRGLGGI
jgi:hypothetical protein